MNAVISPNSSQMPHKFSTLRETLKCFMRYDRSEDRTMIFMLALAMMVTMLIATAFALLNETDRVRAKVKDDKANKFRSGRLH